MVKAPAKIGVLGSNAGTTCKAKYHAAQNMLHLAKSTYELYTLCIYTTCIYDIQAVYIEYILSIEW